jgi:signal transduction histidine kinase
VTERVLYMEDDPAQARLAQKCLERAGYAVDLAGDGAAGLACYAEANYAAVIVDQTMPGLSGLDAIRAMIARKPLPPTIMVTGTGDEHVAVEAMKLGVSDYLVKDPEGGFVSVLPRVLQRSIAERRTLREKGRIEEELAQAQKMKAIGQLAAGIAHEINTPTQYIAHNTRFLHDAFSDISTLLDAYDRLFQAVRKNSVTDELLGVVEAKVRGADLDYLNAEIPQAIGQSLEGVEHVASIVGAMKEFSHPGTGRKQPVDLNHVIEGAIKLCCNEWKYVAEVVTDFDPDLPPVWCLPTDIHRVVVNLVVNATHAIANATHNGADGKRQITIRTRHDEGWAEIRVEDTGTGIPEEIRDRVFDPFFTTKEVGCGTGQGLSLAHAMVVEKHGGTLRFKTEVGRGTSFIVRLPIEGHTCAALAV